MGAREHYAIPRAIALRGQLQCVATDGWVRPRSPLALCNRNLRERFHPELAASRVRSWTLGLVAFELVARARRLSGWPLFVARNRWFQSRLAYWLAAEIGSRRSEVGNRRSEPGLRRPASDSAPVLFSYSYTALASFRIAKKRGWNTVLGQIDPGPPEERIVAELRKRWPQHAGDWQPAPAKYWAEWREECELANVVMVNSEWSREAMIEEGISAEKIAVVPLAYELAGRSEVGTRRSEIKDPSSDHGPFRVLFLGQANLRKGIHDLIAAASIMEAEPVAFDVVGPRGPLPQPLPRNMTFHGPVARGEVSRWYQQADLFALPTHSDGFALTQIEAMAYGLPVVATPRCGAVVEPGRSGWIVDAGKPQQLADAIREAMRDRVKLAAMSAAAIQRIEAFSIVRLAGRLTEISEMLACPRADVRPPTSGF